jgi:D,D-heptose 1,7-bisphosphate phosphatase
MRDWPLYPKPIYRRAVFLDRDGTINVDTHYPHDANLLEIIPSSLDALRILNQLPVHIIVVSNQAGIALEIFTRKDMSNFNKELRTRVKKAFGRIDAFYYCPHLEPKNLKPGQIPCNCSKPSSGMLLEAAEDYNIDLPSSFIIGDKTSDIVAGETVGCTGILVKTGKGGKEEGALPIKTNLIVVDLYEAALIVQSLIEQEQADREEPQLAISYIL